jgi:hypothetical protein
MQRLTFTSGGNEVFLVYPPLFFFHSLRSQLTPTLFAPSFPNCTQVRIGGLLSPTYPQLVKGPLSPPKKEGGEGVKAYFTSPTLYLLISQSAEESLSGSPLTSPPGGGGSGSKEWKEAVGEITGVR